MPNKGNVLINGRTAVHADSQGTLSTVDVCWTRVGKVTVPIPYTNIARSADAAQTATTVFVNGRPVCHKKSIFSKSTGDEPGDRKGIRSGTITEKAEFITASPNVLFEGIPAVRQGDMMVSNNCNTAPMPLSQPGATPAKALDPQEVVEAKGSEGPDRIDIGHAGEKTPLLKGIHRQSEATGATAHKRLARYIDGDHPQRYRELVIGNLEAGKRHRLTLVLNDHQTDDSEPEDREYIVVPLGQTASVSKESPKPKKPSEYANFTVPLVLKRYATADFDKAKATELRTGWLYIFCNGYLWRELQVVQEGFCKDVNLRRYQGQDFRPATGESDSRVIVPWKIDNQRQTVEIAFSEVQWSWARINALGGMNPDTEYETRLKPGTALSKASKKDAADRRSARMQDITDELDRWILNDGEETENIQLIDDVTAEIYSLQLHKQSRLPVVFLQDYLSMLRQKAQQAHEAALEIKKLQDQDGHKRTIGDLAQSIIKSYPDHDKHLRSLEDMEMFCKNFDWHLNEFQYSYNTAQDELIALIQGQRSVFKAIWEDYAQGEDKVPGHQQDIEEAWYMFLSAISPLINKKQVAGEADHAEEPDRLAKLLGSIENPTPEGEIFFDRVLLVNDRTTTHTDNLVALLANFLAKQDSPQHFDRIFKRYRLSHVKVTRELQEITIVPGDYLDKLPKHVRWGAAIDAVTGEPVTAIKGGAIIVPQLFIDGKPIKTMETVVEKFTFETIREQTRVRLRERFFNIEKIHKGFRGLQVLNVCMALRDLSNQIFNEDADGYTITAYIANLASDAFGFAAMFEKKIAASFARNAAQEIAQAQAAMRVGLLNAASGILLAVFESKMAFDEWQSGDMDAAVARGIMATGSLLFSLGGIGAASEAAAAISAGTGALAEIGLVARLATLARFAPLLRLCGWVGVAVTIAGLIYYLYADNDPLEDWLTHCAWGNDAYDGKGTITNRQGEKETIHYADWKKHPGDEIAAALPLMVSYAAEAKWTDNRRKLANHDYKPLWEQLREQPQGFELKVTVPPFKQGKMILQFSFIDDMGHSLRVFTESRRAESYHHAGPARIKGKTAGNGPLPITHSWDIGVADIPEAAIQAEIRLWFDPYGDGNYLLPNNGGLLLIARKGSETHVQSI